MGKKLIISEEERSEIRGKYNLMEQKPYASSGNFVIGDVVAYTPEGYIPRQLAKDIVASTLNNLGGKSNIPMVEKYTKKNNEYVDTNTKIGLASQDAYTIDYVSDGYFFAKNNASTNTYIKIPKDSPNENDITAKRFMKIK
jgi:PPE-repeat protein